MRKLCAYSETGVESLDKLQSIAMDVTRPFDAFAIGKMQSGVGRACFVRLAMNLLLNEKNKKIDSVSGALIAFNSIMVSRPGFTFHGLFRE